MNCAAFGESLNFLETWVHEAALIPVHITPVVLCVCITYKWQVLCGLISYESAFFNRHVTFINPIKTKMKLENVARFILYCAVNTAHLGYKNPVS